MKLNWGSGIAIFYVCFMAAMIGMVIKSTYNQTHLVVENYYQKDLNYEAFRSKRENAKRLKNDISIAYDSQSKQIEVKLPAHMVSASGTITLYRPSDKHHDRVIGLKLSSEAKMNIPIQSNMARGLWTVQLDWEDRGKAFYTEEQIVI